MLNIKSAQVDFTDIRIRRLLGDLQEMHTRAEFAMTNITGLLEENPENRHLTLEQVSELEPNGISMRYILEQLGFQL